MAASCGEVAWLDVSREHGMVLQEEDAPYPRSGSRLQRHSIQCLSRDRSLTPHGRESG